MSDRDETSGQFVESNLVGERAAEAAAGYIPHVEEPEAVGPADAKELGESLAELRGHDAEPEPVLGLTDPNDDSPRQAFSRQQLVEHLAEERRTHDSMAEMVGNAEVAAFADALRAHLNGTDTAEQPAPKAEVEQPAGSEAEPMVEGLAPELDAALKHPQVRQAIEAELNTANQTREAYTAGLEQARVTSLATLAEVVPHLAGLPPAQFEQGLALLAQVDPPAFQKTMDILGRVHTITQAQQQAQRQQAYVQHQQFEATVTAEDARLTEMFGGDKAAADAATDATISYLAEQGIPRQQMLQVFKANPVLSTAEARQLVWKAKQYDNIQQAKVTAAAKPAPQVQRPGVPASSAERSASALNDRTARARSRIDGGKGDARDIASLIGSLRRA
jgi:hypothetical protein